MAIARFPSLPKTAPAAEKLASDIQYAKELALRLQTMSGVYFLNDTSYRVFQDNDTNKATIDPVTGGAFEVTLSGHLSGVTLGQAFSGDTIKFDALGTPFDGSDAPLDSAGTITVTFGSENKTITIEPNTGKVSVS